MKCCSGKSHSDAAQTLLAPIQWDDAAQIHPLCFYVYMFGWRYLSLCVTYMPFWSSPPFLSHTPSSSPRLSGSSIQSSHYSHDCMPQNLFIYNKLTVTARSLIIINTLLSGFSCIRLSFSRHIWKRHLNLSRPPHTPPHTSHQSRWGVKLRKTGFLIRRSFGAQ